MIAQTAPLASVLPGSFICTAIDDSSLSPARMKSLGICVGRPLELLSVGDPMILRVCGSSVGLSRQLAAAVTVAPQPAAADLDTLESNGAQSRKAAVIAEQPLLASV